ncbi:MAG: PAS domain S-box protein [candidate division NC10 bacterium]|nr:PAS domain S-box protein [candidate division NC10 bacterium]
MEPSRVEGKEEAGLRREREALARDLSVLRAFYEDLLASLQDGVVVVDADLVILAVNPAAEELLGRSATSAMGRALPALMGPGTLLPVLAARALETGRAHAEHGAALTRADGEQVWVSAVVSLLADPGGRPRGCVLALRDLTRIRDLEEQLRQADRMAALGALAAGLSHEIRNPLMGIRGAAQLLASDPALPAAFREHSGIILREVDRLNALVEGILGFARPHPARLTPCNLNQVLEEVLVLEEGGLTERGVRVRRVYDPQIPPVQGDAAQLYQVFLNLVRNAGEAMPGGGELTLQTSYERRSPRCRGVSVAVAEVRDQGSGLGPEASAHLFEPFFTTKEKGTGLGLAICQRIVQEHRGVIEVQSEAGKGTCFAVLLPLAGEQP